RDTITDFEVAIEQKHATITAIDLPVIDAVPIQIEQLFGNLLSNGLKYSRDGIAPFISVTATIATQTEKQAHALLPGRLYYKIEFRDNGIGFSQEYSEQIFQIFQRLHGKNEYEGTGIGLAMCRKIAQNHEGLIFASSSGEGALFTVILPAVQNNSEV
ncbi:MAG: PAS domain-containing sensor histidine kinase, partial [Proteobacteria bacterium]